jgi:hypothetical protein
MSAVVAVNTNTLNGRSAARTEGMKATSRMTTMAFSRAMSRNEYQRTMVMMVVLEGSPDEAGGQAGNAQQGGVTVSGVEAPRIHLSS